MEKAVDYSAIPRQTAIYPAIGVQAMHSLR
jgi:hypothetical protein